jgi:hypothetical protein
MSYLVKAIRKLKPTAEFSYTNNDYSTIKWDILEGNAPTQAEIDAAIEVVKTEEVQAEAKAASDKAALLARLGITSEEAQLLLGGN